MVIYPAFYCIRSIVYFRSSQPRIPIPEYPSTPLPPVPAAASLGSLPDPPIDPALVAIANSGTRLIDRARSLIAKASYFDTCTAPIRSHDWSIPVPRPRVCLHQLLTSLPITITITVTITIQDGI